jgi:hypothetical protein
LFAVWWRRWAWALWRHVCWFRFTPWKLVRYV